MIIREAPVPVKEELAAAAVDEYVTAEVREFAVLRVATRIF
jgi:hypothetical protein